MDFIISRTKGLFQYGDIKGETRNTADGDSLDLETERSGIVSANASVRRRRRCIWLGSLASGLVAIIIIAAAVKNRHHLQAAAEALVKSAAQEKPRVGDNKPNKSAYTSKPKIKYNDFLRYRFYPDYFNGTWISDNEILFPDQFGGLSVNNVATSQIQTVVSHNQFRKIHPVLYEFSADRSVRAGFVHFMVAIILHIPCIQEVFACQDLQSEGLEKIIIWFLRTYKNEGGKTCNH